MPGPAAPQGIGCTSCLTTERRPCTPWAHSTLRFQPEGSSRRNQPDTRSTARTAQHDPDRVRGTRLRSRASGGGRALRSFSPVGSPLAGKLSQPGSQPAAPLSSPPSLGEVVGRGSSAPLWLPGCGRHPQREGSRGRSATAFVSLLFIARAPSAHRSDALIAQKCGAFLEEWEEGSKALWPPSVPLSGVTTGLSAFCALPEGAPFSPSPQTKYLAQLSPIPR